MYKHPNAWWRGRFDQAVIPNHDVVRHCILEYVTRRPWELVVVEKCILCMLYTHVYGAVANKCWVPCSVLFTNVSWLRVCTNAFLAVRRQVFLFYLRPCRGLDCCGLRLVPDAYLLVAWFLNSHPLSSRYYACRCHLRKGIGDQH